MTDVVATTPAQAFLNAVRERRADFEAAARHAEDERTLPADVVELMRDLRLFWLKTPRELGGSELDPLEFCDVLEEIAYYDASAAWTAMVGNGTTGTVAGWLPEEGLREVFAEQDLPICAGQFVARGTAVPVDGGYTVSGRGGSSSGSNHTGWLVGGCKVADSEEQILVVVPKSEATYHDTWYVAGLQGTGSGDYSLAEVFVPTARTFAWPSTAVRGGALFEQPPVLFVSNELGPVVVGIARRAIDEMYALAGATERRLNRAYMGERAAFHKEIGRAEARVRAASLLYRNSVAETWTVAQVGDELGPSFVPRMLAQHTLVVEECADVVVQIIRYGGGRVLALSHPMQRHLRNLLAARQHVYVSEENLAGTGATLVPWPTTIRDRGRRA
jgi:alkylation response protein AidB-like acyl-CoA dehydrogenase